MTKENYSIQGLKDLLNNLEQLSTCTMTLREIENVSSEAYNKLMEEQHSIIEKANAYAGALKGELNAEFRS